MQKHNDISAVQITYLNCTARRKNYVRMATVIGSVKRRANCKTGVGGCWRTFMLGRKELAVVVNCCLLLSGFGFKSWSNG